MYGPTGDSMQVFYFADFADHPPLGAVGGGPGGAALVSKLERDGTEVALDPIGDVTLKPGEWVVAWRPAVGATATAGAAMLRRWPATSRSAGYRSRPHASTTAWAISHGSVPGEVHIDEAATEELRERLRTNANKEDER